MNASPPEIYKDETASTKTKRVKSQVFGSRTAFTNRFISTPESGRFRSDKTTSARRQNAL